MSTSASSDDDFSDNEGEVKRDERKDQDAAMNVPEFGGHSPVDWHAQNPAVDSDDEGSDSQSVRDRAGSEERRGARSSATGEGKAEDEAVFSVGDDVDVLDSVNKWSEAEIVEVDPRNLRVKVTYRYWSNKWDEWVDMDSHRIQAPRSMTYHQGGELRVNQRIEVLDERSVWMEAHVLETTPTHVRIHYMNFHPKFDETIPRGSSRIRPFGQTRASAKPRPIARERQVSLSTLPRVRKMTTTSHSYDHYTHALRVHHLAVWPIDGDGNCMFRSISHQVYGDDRFHHIVREKCMAYMESERLYFEPYVEGDMAAFMTYLQHKRQLGVWGDDPELQALCEIYDRPAEVWSYDPVTGAKKMRTFHEVSSNTRERPPMRLSYYGGGHYDSIVGPGHQEALLRTLPGAVEDSRIQLSQAGSHMNSDETKSGVELNEVSQMAAALQASREEFDRVAIDLDQCLQQDLETALAQADREATDSVLIASAEQNELQHAMQVSASEDADKAQLQEALAMSAVDAEDPELQHVLALSADSQDDDIKRALELSRQDGLGATMVDDGDLAMALALSRQEQGTFPADDDDLDLQRALAFSSSM